MQPTPNDTERLTIEDYRATPEGTRYQLVDGELYRMSPAPNLFHQEIVGNVFIILKKHADDNRLGRVLIAPCDVYLSTHNVVQPDVLFVAAANTGILAPDGVRGAPDLVVEIISLSTAQLDKTAKRRVYAGTGVKELWLIDPIQLQIHLYVFARDSAKAIRLVEDDETFESALLPGLTIASADVFKR